MTARKPRAKRTGTTATTEPTAKAKAPARTRKTTKTGTAASGKTARPAPVGSGSGYVGFTSGSASEAAAVALVRGGHTRTSIMNDLREADEQVNSSTNGLSKSWSVAISSVIASLTEKGWTEEGTYRLVPPDGVTVNLPPDEDGVYMPKRDLSVPRRGRRRNEELATPAPKTKTRRTRTAVPKAVAVTEDTAPAPVKKAPVRGRRPRRRASAA